MANAYVNSIQHIYTTLPAGGSASGDNTNDITITSVTTGQTMVIAQCRPPTNPGRGHAAFELVNSTTLRAHRVDNRSAVEVQIMIIGV